MIIDIIVGAIIVVVMVFGYRSGFVKSFLHLVGWIIAAVLGFVWFPQVKAFLLDKTDFYDSVYNNIYEKTSEPISTAGGSLDSLPSVIGNGYDLLTAKFSAAEASALADLIFTILSFLAIILIIKLMILLISLAISKKHNDGLPGLLDGLLGCFFGLVKGLFLVFVLLAFAVPLIGLSNPEHAQTIMDAIQDSRLTLALYDNNLLLLIVRDFMM